MEPRRDDGDDALSHLDEVRREHRAAMEPRRDDGDDGTTPTLTRSPWSTPQWSPVVTTGTTPASPRQWARLWRPQWSPVVTTGTTRRNTFGRLNRRFHAAMEPRRDDGDDVPRDIALSPTYASPQWSPVVTTGTTLRTWCRSTSATSPQWSPVVTTGTTFQPISGFNLYLWPQWSPVVTTGTTCPDDCGCRASDATAAMEPRRDDGDDAGRTGSPSRTWCRNGAPS